MREPDVYAGFDEFKKDGFFATTFVLIERRAAAGFVESWRHLQQLVRVVLLENYPSGPHTPDLLSGALPEIHAAPMFNSNPPYRKYLPGQEPPTDKEYYLMHYQWLEVALQIFKAWGLKFYTGFFYFGGRPYNELTPEEQASVGQSCQQLFEDLALRYPADTRIYNAPALKALVNDPYFYHVTHALTALEDHLDRTRRYGRLFCDIQGKYGHKLMNTEVFGALRRSGCFLHLEPPTFLPSKRNELLQVADVVGYVAGNHYLHEMRGDSSPNPWIEHWWNEYVKDAQEAAIRDLHKTRRPATATAIQLEVAAETCIFDPRVRDEFKKDLRLVIGPMLDGRDIRDIMREWGIDGDDDTES